jgi:hypothetical protein
MPRPTRSRSDLDLAKVDWRQVDGTSEDEIAQQADSDRDTAPVFGPEGIVNLAKHFRNE